MRTIFITGISRGLGLRLAEHFLALGERVIGISRTRTEALQDLMSRYAEQLVWHAFDLGQTAELEQRLLQCVPELNDRIDVFIDNAALLMQKLVHQTTEAEYQSVVAVNAVAPMMLTSLVVRNMLRHRTRGAILHISSICAHKAYTGLALMGATKAAIEAFSRTTAKEYGRFGIRSNTLVGGLIDTGMNAYVNQKQLADIEHDAALGRIVEAEEVVRLADFLTSGESMAITGQNYYIDGGIV